VAGFYEPSGSRKMLFDKLNDYQLFKVYPAPWSKQVMSPSTVIG
jgi:hypothetical protein